MIHVIGANGRLGSVLSSTVSTLELNRISRNVYENWWQDESIDAIRLFFSTHKHSRSSILIASGVLDPKLSIDEHLRINYLLPKNIIAATSDLGIRILTFGTVSEHFQSEINTYIRSKKLLCDYILNNPEIAKTVVHVRLHTLYGGGFPNNFMFLGKVYESIAKKLPMEMTSGRQIREYHHIEDDVSAIWKILESDFVGAIDLNHGAPITLINLAQYLFHRFNCEKFLRVGSLPEPIVENYERIFLAHPIYAETEFRLSLPSVGDYIEKLLNDKVGAV